MKNFTRFLFLALVSLIGSQLIFGQVIISEMCDPQSEYANNRFIEIYNAGESAQDLTGWSVDAIGNTAVIFTWTLSGSIASGEALVCGDDDASTVGFTPDFQDASWSTSNSSWNGKTGDGAKLYNAAKALVDDAQTTSDFYENKTAERNVDIGTPNTTWTSTEWTSTSVTNASDATPGTHTCDYPAPTTTVVEFSSASATVAEGDGTYDLIISITNEDGSNATECDVVLISGTAADIDNYTTQHVTFIAGSSADETVTVTITDDSEFEADEVFTFEIQSVTGGNAAAAGNQDSFDLTITSDDPASTTLPYAETFEADLGDCYVYNVSGATKEWIHSSNEGGVAYCSGYNSGDTEEDWIVLPGVNLDNYSNEVMTFDTWKNYGADDVNNYFELHYSTDYAGVGDPSGANWTELSFTAPAGTEAWTESGDIDLSGISGTSVYIAFKYHYESGSYRTWYVDNLDIHEVNPATKLVITSVSPTSPTVDATFSVTVEAQDASSIAANVDEDTDVLLAVQVGTEESLSGTKTGTITAGTSSVEFTGLSYDVVETIEINASVTSGMALTTSSNQSITIMEDMSGYVIINEIDGAGDPDYNEEAVELLVVNGPISLRNWTLREDSESNEMVFADNAAWDDVPTGTTIGIYVRSTSTAIEDVDYSDGSMVVISGGSYISGTIAIASAELFYLFAGASGDGNAVDAVNCGETISEYYGLTIPDLGSGANKYFAKGSDYNNDVATDWFDYGAETGRTFGAMNPGQGDNPYEFDNGGGDGDWTNVSNWSTGVVPTANTSVSIPDGLMLTIPAGKAVAECYDLTLEAGSMLQIEGTLNVYGDLLVVSDATGTGSLIDNGTLAVSGNTGVELYLAQDQYWYVSMPITTGNSSIFSASNTTDNHIYYWFEGPTGGDVHGWNRIQDDVTDLNVMQGYAVKFTAADETLNFTGSLNTGSQASGTLTRNAGQTYEGYNLVGNPYPSGIDWGNDQVSGDGQFIWPGGYKDNVDASIWIRRSSSGDFAEYSAASGLGNPSSDVRYIPAMQGFWIRVTDGQTEGTLTMDNTVRVHEGTFYGKSSTELPYVRLALATNGKVDETIVAFIEEATEGYDIYDTEKMFSDDSEYPQIYTEIESNAIAINSFPELIDSRVVSLYMLTVEGVEYTITASDYEYLPEEVDIMLQDNSNGNMIDLRTENYSFTGTANDNERFILHILKSGTSIDPEDLSNNSIQIYSYGHELYIRSEEALNGALVVYDMIGKEVMRTEISGPYVKFDMQKLDGYHIIKYIGIEKSKTVKVLFK